MGKKNCSQEALRRRTKALERLMLTNPFTDEVRAEMQERFGMTGEETDLAIRLGMLLLRREAAEKRKMTPQQRERLVRQIREAREAKTCCEVVFRC